MLVGNEEDVSERDPECLKSPVGLWPPSLPPVVKKQRVRALAVIRVTPAVDRVL